MKYVYVIIGFLGLVLSLFFIFPMDKSDSDQVCFDSECFNVEVVSSGSDREKGLMFRESLDRDSGMLFIFDSEGLYPFWMKNTLIPLDIIWINSDFEIVYIAHNSMPCEEDPCPLIRHDGTAKYVLEINGGLASKLGIEVGDKASFDLTDE